MLKLFLSNLFIFLTLTLFSSCLKAETICTGSTHPLSKNPDHLYIIKDKNPVLADAFGETKIEISDTEKFEIITYRHPISKKFSVKTSSKILLIDLGDDEKEEFLEVNEIKQFKAVGKEIDFEFKVDGNWKSEWVMANSDETYYVSVSSVDCKEVSNE